MRVERFTDEAAALYQLPPEEFVDRRTQRAKELRDRGDRDVARQVARLRKPTLSAWAVDQLAHRHPADLRELFRAGDELRDIYERGDGGRDRMQSTMGTVRELVADLRESAVNQLVDIGATVESHVDDIEQTLTAAAIDPRARDDVRDGILARPVSSIGFSALTNLQRRGATAGSDGRDDRMRRAEQRRLEQRIARLRRRAEEARKRADRLRKEAGEAEALARQRESDLRHAETELAELGLTV